MPQDPFPARGPDGEEPDGSAALPARGTGPDDDWDGDAHMEALLAVAGADEDEAPPEEEGPAQGLYVCLPAGQLTLAGFARRGQAGTMTPGPLLATVMHAVTGEDGQGLAALDEDQLIGVISAARRLESRIAWTQLAAIREFAARRPASPGRTGARRPGSASSPPMSWPGSSACPGRLPRSRSRTRARWRSGCRAPSPRWPPGRSTRCT